MCYVYRSHPDDIQQPRVDEKADDRAADLRRASTHRKRHFFPQREPIHWPRPIRAGRAEGLLHPVPRHTHLQPPAAAPSVATASSDPGPPSTHTATPAVSPTARHSTARHNTARQGRVRHRTAAEAARSTHRWLRYASSRELISTNLNSARQCLPAEPVKLGRLSLYCYSRPRLRC